jgi:hypothetical protein
VKPLTPEEETLVLFFAGTTVELEEHRVAVEELAKIRRTLLKHLLIGRTEREVAQLVKLSQPRVRQLVGILCPPGGTSEGTESDPQS